MRYVLEDSNKNVVGIYDTLEKALDEAVIGYDSKVKFSLMDDGSIYGIVRYPSFRINEHLVIKRYSDG